MNRLSPILHIMYILIMAGAMFFIAVERSFVGWSLFFVAIGVWSAMFGVETKNNNNDQ